MLPPAFLDRVRQQLGPEYEAFLASYHRPRALGLRLNPLKTDRPPILPFTLSPLPYLQARNRSARINLLLILFLTLVNIAMLFADGESYYLFSALLPYWLVGFGYYQEVTALIVAGGALLVLYLVCFLLWNKHPAVSVAALVMFVVDCGFMAWLLLGEPIADNLMEILLHVLVLAYLIYGVYIAFALRKKQKEVAELERANQGPEL